MKILFVCDTLNSGGAERVISTLSNEFIKLGNNVSIVMIGSDAKDSFYPLDSKVGIIPLFKESDHKNGFLNKAKQLKSKITNLQPDIVISFLSYVCIYTWWALRKTNIPYIVSERNDPYHRGRIKQFLLNRSFKKASGCVFQTEDALNWYEKIVKGKSCIIPNPVNISAKTKNLNSFKKQLLYVGRFSEQKNCKMLIDAFNEFGRTHSDYTLKMYGNGPLKDSIQQQVDTYNLSNRVSICESSKTWQQDECDSAMFILPSNYEGMPNVLAEALCLGIPSVATDCTIGGPKELKKYFGDLLTLTKPNDSTSMVEAMNKALQVKQQSIFIPEELEKEAIARRWLDFITVTLSK